MLGMVYLVSGEVVRLTPMFMADEIRAQVPQSIALGLAYLGPVLGDWCWATNISCSQWMLLLTRFQPYGGASNHGRDLRTSPPVQRTWLVCWVDGGGSLMKVVCNRWFL